MKMLTTIFSLIFSAAASAHVKWFSDYDFQQKPLEFSDLNTPVFWFLFALSVVSLALFVYLDKLAEKSQLYHKVNSFLDRYSDQGPLIMRVSAWIFPWMTPDSARISVLCGGVMISPSRVPKTLERSLRKIFPSILDPSEIIFRFDSEIFSIRTL